MRLSESQRDAIERVKEGKACLFFNVDSQTAYVADSLWSFPKDRVYIDYDVAKGFKKDLEPDDCYSCRGLLVYRSKESD